MHARSTTSDNWCTGCQLWHLECHQFMLPIIYNYQSDKHARKKVTLRLMLQQYHSETHGSRQSMWTPLLATIRSVRSAVRTHHEKPKWSCIRWTCFMFPHEESLIFILSKMAKQTLASSPDQWKRPTSDPSTQWCSVAAYIMRSISHDHLYCDIIKHWSEWQTVPMWANIQLFNHPANSLVGV